jgi:release factor glutamine methyltransferase
MNMNCGQALEQARLVLNDCGVEEPFLEGEILLRHILGIDRATLFASLKEELPPVQAKLFLQLVDRRRLGEPSAYITGHREFFGLDFKVDRRVLIPRPETELLVERAIDLCRRNKFATIADIGTGSGCIAISLAMYLTGVRLYAVDISADALAVADSNSILHDVQRKITLLQGDLLRPLTGPVDIIVANLPYVRTADITSKSEPELALDGGVEGLDKINDLCRQAPGKIKPGGRLLLEIGQGQADAVTTILHNTFPDGIVDIHKDLAGIARLVSVRLT